MLYHVTSWCDLLPYQPDPEELCEEQWLIAKLIDLLKADVADQQYVVGIVRVCACVLHSGPSQLNGTKGCWYYWIFALCVIKDVDIIHQQN